MTEDISNQRINIFMKESQFTPIELFFNEIFTSNVYIGEDLHKNKAFMIKISQNDLSCSLIDNIEKINKLNCSTLLKFVSLSSINNECYLIYEFCNGIRFNDYIMNAVPKALKRIHLLKQLIDILKVFYKDQIQLFPLKDEFIFIDSLEDLNIKMLYANGSINEKHNEKEKDQEQDQKTISGNKELESQNAFNPKEYFLWVASFVYSITKYNMKSDSENFNMFFNEFDDHTSAKMKNFFSKILNKSQINNTDNYSFDELSEEFKKLCDGLSLISVKEENKPSSNPFTISNPLISTLSLSSSTVDQPKLIRPSFDKKSSITSSTTGLLFSTKTTVNHTTSNAAGSKFQNTAIKDSKGDDSINKKKLKQSTKKGNVSDNIIKIPLKEEMKLNTTEASNVNNYNMLNQNNNNCSNSMNLPYNQSFNDNFNHNLLNSMHGMLMQNPQLNPIRIQNPIVNGMGEYRNWLYQSLIRMNNLDQIVKSQLLQIDTLWNNIQYSHNQFLNQMVQKGPNTNTQQNNINQ